MDIVTFFWFVLVIFTYSLILLLFYRFLKDKDLRKLMFILGLLPSTFTFLYLGFQFPLIIPTENSLFFNVYRWGTIPIIESFFFVIADRIIYRKKEFKLPFFMFLFFYILSFILILLNIMPDAFFYASLQIGTLLIIVLCIGLLLKERNYSNWLFLFSVCCFTIAGMSLSMYIRQAENISSAILTLFSFFLAYIFLALIFGLTKSLKETGGIATYFSFEERLKKVEAALYDSEQKYRQVVENLNEGLWILTTDASTTYTNSFLAKMLGYNTDEMIGKPYLEFIDDSGKKIINEKLNHVLDDVNNEYEFEFIRKNKTRMSAYVTISPLFDINGKNTGLLLGVQDITNRRKMEGDLHEKLEKLQKSELATLNIMEDLQKSIIELQNAKEEINLKNEELQMMNQELNVAKDQLAILNQDLESKVQQRTSEVEMLLKQKDEFIGQLGHDLKTPLTPLNILLPIIIEREQDSKIKELLNVISNNIQYMKNLVVKTLALAQLNSPNTKFEIQDIDLSDQIRVILDLESPLFEGKDIVVENNIPAEIIVQADLIQIRELFDNLISNAVKYSQKCGGKIIFDAQKKDDVILISVKDTGIGLEPNQLEHVFDEFYKVDTSRHDLQSTGLGLSICKKIVERHGGRIWAESQGRGKGSTFFFTFKSGNTIGTI